MYTPRCLANWLATEVVDRLGGASEVTVVDPACGEGVLLAAVDEIRPGEFDLIGVDIDPEALSSARRRVGRGTYLRADALVDDLDVIPSSGSRLAIVANPPWGTQAPGSGVLFKKLGFELAKGQFDSFELFVERVVKMAPSGSVVGLIIPDSLFLPEHSGVRQFLLERCHIELLARLGEGFFPGVFRGTAVVVARVGAADAGAMTKCVRLPHDVRREVLAGHRTLGEVMPALCHSVRQRRFAENEGFEFNIDQRDADTGLKGGLNGQTIHWDELFSIGRGVEIGKRGKALRCSCGHHRPFPRSLSRRLKCDSCGRALTGEIGNVTEIIRPAGDVEGQHEWKPILAGEDINRYRSQSARRILVGLPGISYKTSDAFEPPKLLVRKTGIGIRATIDTSDALTTQTVFHFRLRNGHQQDILYYLLGMLNSRVILAHHLTWSGDNEWRSHPYVTPKTIKQLPVPDPENSSVEPAYRAIASLARERLVAEGQEAKRLEMRIEFLIAEALGMSRKDRKRVISVLASSQPLALIREVRFGREEAAQFIAQA